jgi:hypothetical protein
MFNQSTRTMYDKNEATIKNVVSEKPLRWVTNQNMTFKSYRNGDILNVQEETSLREKPTRLNYYNRQNEYTASSPYENLRMKPVMKETELIYSLESTQRTRHETDQTVTSEIQNWNPVMFELPVKHTPEEFVLGGASSRNSYRNIYTCPEK